MSDCCCAKSLKRLAIVPGAIRASLVGATSVSSTGLRRLLKQKRPLLSLRRRLRLCRIHHGFDCPFHDKHIQSPRGRPSFVYRLLSLAGFLTLNPFSCCRTVASPFPAHHQLRARAVSLSPTNVLLLRGHVLSKTSTPFHEPLCTGFHTSLRQPDTSPAPITHCLFHRRPIHLLPRPQTKRHSSNSHRIFTCPTARSARHLCKKWKPLVVTCTLVANRGSAAVRSSVTHSLWQLLQ